MGEAKRRGSSTDRVKQAVEAKQEKPVAELIEELGLPASSKYLGYVIHCPDTDDYLGSDLDGAGIIKRAYVKTPDFALRYGDYGEVVQAAARISARTHIGILFDVDDQHIVAFNE